MTTTTRLTLEQFLAMPETKPYREYEDGEVTRKKMPSLWHMTVQRLLSVVFSVYMQSHSRWNAGPELRCIFGPAGHERAYVPDFAVFRASLADPAVNGPLQAAPDLAIEILSPDDRMSRVHRKVRFYLRYGVRIVWIVDPQNREVTVMTEPNRSFVFSDDDVLDGGAVLPGFRVPVRDILPPPVE